MESISLLISHDTVVFGISVDSYATLKKYREELGLPFDLLSDWFRDVSQSYGVFNTREGVAMRFSFLIDKKGVVRFVQSSKLIEPRNHKKMLEKIKEIGAEP